MWNNTPKWQDLVFGKFKHPSCVSLGAKSSCAGQQNTTTLLSFGDWTTWAKSNRADFLRRKCLIIFFVFLFAGFLLPNLLSSRFLACLALRGLLFLACFTLLACYIPFFIWFSFFIYFSPSFLSFSFFLSFFSLFLNRFSF